MTAAIHSRPRPSVLALIGVALAATLYVVVTALVNGNSTAAAVPPTVVPTTAALHNSHPRPAEMMGDAELETTDYICSALFFLRKLSPHRPESALTPFQFLRLDPNARPFKPVDKSAHAGAPWYGLVRAAVQEAVVRVRASVWPRYVAGEENAAAVIDALWHVGHMLTDDASRLRFLDQVQPKLEASSWHQSQAAADRSKAKVITGLCSGMWSRRAWE
ncbi:hypothetical protein QIS74_04923 [Colletotrichum tabaci]|uniref:Uncharacterized protein n=1 Tax=Colletotrichum tabaci TaxID=1209068 RepID=A0AAV9TID7_9PEZI